MTKELLVPKLSDNISFHPFSADSLFVHQKAYGHRVKISNQFYELLKRIDGEKNLKELADEPDMVEFDVNILYEILYNRLGVYGVIESDEIEVKKKKKPSYLKLSFILIPSHVIGKVTPHLKFLFRPKIMKLLLIFCTSIIAIGVISNFQEISALDLQSIWFQLLIFGFISVTFHEFGHASAAHYFGAEHGGIGGGFYLFSPVYYADVTDIWKLEPKKRIIVNLAGIYFELLVCSIYVITGIIFNFNVLQVVGLFIVFNTLFNLNPFLRSDGYWVLSDLLVIPNLYKKSSESLKRLLNAVFRKEKIKVTKREFLLAMYASINYMFMGFFLYYIAIINPQSVLFLPTNLYDFIASVYGGNQQVTLANLTEFILPFLFYYLLLKFLYGKIKKLLISKD